ncbi:MAG: transglycosylase SLT domain-containing protein, partial [Pseudorhodoplanes sp.]
MKKRNRPFSSGLLAAVAFAASIPAAEAASKQVPLPRPRPAVAPKVAAAPARAAMPASLTPPAPTTPRVHTAALQTSAPLAVSNAANTSAREVAIVQQAVALVKKGRISDATAAAQNLNDPLARKLVEWIILRNDDNGAEFARYNAFIAANPSWPSVSMFRRRAEQMLWQERSDPQTVRSFFASAQPMTAKGRLALARALSASGDRAGAAALVREAWRNDDFSGDLESQVLEMFPNVVTAADDKARMDRRLYDEDVDTALRAAKRAGATAMAIARARIAVMRKSANAKAMLDAVPDSAQKDAGYMFNRIQWLRRQDKTAEAAQVMLAVPRDRSAIHDPDEWWVERRVLARKLLDENDPRTAYRVVRDAATPEKGIYRVDQQFTAGWIALRFLNDPATATQHFNQFASSTDNPTALARAAYWLGRAAESAGRRDEARRHYERGAVHQTTYYGQLARARLGLGEIRIHAPHQPDAFARANISRLEVVRAIEILYAIDERDLVIPIVADLGERATDMGVISVVAHLCGRNNDARATLLLGKGALRRGLPADAYAFPIEGLPRYTSIGPAVEPSVAYSIARQESGFNPRVVSSANALGLMQVTPAAGKYIAKKYNAVFDQKRLLNDSVYNMQMGAAELGGLIEDYRGSYIMTFVGYNAGRGRVRQWIERYGDPRDPKVDAV